MSVVAFAGEVSARDALDVERLLSVDPPRPTRYMPSGHGLHLDRGGPPDRPVTLLRLDALHRVIEIAPTDLTITAEAGVLLQDLVAALREHRLWLPSIPAGDDGSVGGLLGSDRRGPLAGSFGTVRDHVIGVVAVNGAGQRIEAGGRVVKNVAGYDLMKLFIGSLGELAAITSVTFKVLPIPSEWGGIVVRGEGAQALADPRAGLFPAALARVRDHVEEPRTLALFAGPHARVGAQAERARDQAGGEMLANEACLPLLEAAHLAGRPRGSASLWGGALPSALRSARPEDLGPGPWLIDLLGGHFWSARAENAPAWKTFLGEQGHVHVDGSPEHAWGSEPGEEEPLWRELKRAFDPHDRLVSGRLPGGV